jgi:hypothetical protein
VAGVLPSPTCSGSLKMILKGPFKEEAEKVKDGLVGINLKGFTDTDKLGVSQPLLSVNLIRGKKKLLLSEVPVLALITSWQVSNLRESHQPSEDNLLHIHFKWDEKGKAMNKIIRIWQFKKPWSPLCQKSLELNQDEFTLRVDRKVLLPGNYLAELLDGKEEEAFETSKNSFISPGEGVFSHVFEIKREDPYVKSWQAKRKGSPHVLLSGKLKNVKRRKINLEAVFLGLQDGQAPYKERQELL